MTLCYAAFVILILGLVYLLFCGLRSVHMCHRPECYNPRSVGVRKS